MKLNVLFFGATRDVAGTRSLEIEFDPGSTSSEILNRVLTDHPRLSTHKLLFAVNTEYGNGTEVVREGDEFAIFTAVSGG